jgi:hypothetical protein
VSLFSRDRRECQRTSVAPPRSRAPYSIIFSIYFLLTEELWLPSARPSRVVAVSGRAMFEAPSSSSRAY